MKEYPLSFNGPMVRAVLSGNKTQTRRTSDVWAKRYRGEKLWVRENYAIHKDFVTTPQKPVGPGLIIYQADDWPCPPIEKWRPSIFMWRWASRINLEIVSIRQERLQDISEDDAKSEGAKKTFWFHRAGTNEQDDITFCGITEICYKNGFATLWEEINGPGSWDANPLVYPIEFKRVV
jgi:hypothetical protein